MADATMDSNETFDADGALRRSDLKRSSLFLCSPPWRRGHAATSHLHRISRPSSVVSSPGDEAVAAHFQRMQRIGNAELIS